ncbi:hypothetical protein ACLKA6_013232 [Drosophila palustris]
MLLTARHQLNNLQKMSGRLGQTKVGDGKLPWYFNLYKTIKDAPINLTLLLVSAFVFYKVVTITRNRRNENRLRGLETGPKSNKNFLPSLLRDFTVRELREYNGTRDDGRILLAVNLNVYDVSSAQHFYGKDGAYPHYAGRDISRILINLDNNGREGFDNLSDLTEAQTIALLSWDKQYAEKYPLVGLVVPERRDYTNNVADEDEDDDEDVEMIPVRNHMNHTRSQFMIVATATIQTSSQLFVLTAPVKYRVHFRFFSLLTSKMKIGLCAFSGYKIYPGHGKTMVKIDGKTFTFLDKKCERSYLMKRNPRKVTWTVLYRRKHRKGIEEEASKKRTRRTQKFQRAIVGASLAEIMAKRNMKPEVRKAQRDQAIKVAKEQKRAVKAAKKAAAPAPAKKSATKQKATKVTQKAAPRVGGKR